MYIGDVEIGKEYILNYDNPKVVKVLDCDAVGDCTVQFKNNKKDVYHCSLLSIDLTYYIKELNRAKCIVVSYKVKTDLVKYLEDNHIKFHCEMDDYFQYHIHLM